jgi:uncharacterized membrane protein (UPF0127 family)
MHSFRKFWRQLLLLAVLAAVVGAFSLRPKAEAPLQPGCPFTFSGACVSMELATTPLAQETGLSNRDSLPMRQGMLFVFAAPQSNCFWMKDMRFALDMIWLNNRKEIVQIRENVKPNTYPASFCADNTRYVIEVNAGVAGMAGLRAGQRLNF